MTIIEDNQILILLSQFIRMINKKGYIQFLCETLKSRISDLEVELDSIDDEIAKETKSSAGDKFETSREMMSQARARVEEQVSKIGNQIRTLKEIIPNSNTGIIAHGSIVETDKGIFFFGVALEKMIFENKTIYNLSMNSPIGQVFNGKSIDEAINFRNTAYHILNVE